MKRLLFSLSILMLLISCSKDPKPIINYTVSPLTENGEHLLKVKLTFETDDTGQSILLFQDKAWGQDSLHNVIKNIEILSEKGDVIASRDSNWFEVIHPKELKQLELEYTIKSNLSGDLTTWDTYRPIVNSEYFHLFSHNFFMLPKTILDASKDSFDVMLQWNDFPEDYTIANSFGSNDREQYIESVSEEKFHTAVFVGGDFRTHEISIKDNKVAAVTMIPTIQERGSSFQGSGLTNSFAINATNNKYLEVEGLVYLFNHELQHNWIGSLIKNDAEEKQYWFSEGFTDYYTIKNIAKGKIYNLDESYFIKEFNAFVKALYTNPVREMPNSEMNYDNFWSGKEGVQKLPYRRGALLAFYLDNKIQQDTKGEKSLDDVLLDFKNAALKSEQTISHPYFINTLNTYLNEDFKPFFDKHIENGKLYNLETIFEDFGFEYTPISKVFDLGFKFSEDKKRIIFVDETSVAYNAGLREGDHVKNRSYYYDSIEHEAEFTVVRDGKDIAVKYLPVRDAAVPQLMDTAHNKTLLNF